MKRSILSLKLTLPSFVCTAELCDSSLGADSVDEEVFQDYSYRIFGTDPTESPKSLCFPYIPRSQGPRVESGGVGGGAEQGGGVEQWRDGWHCAQKSTCADSECLFD